MDDEGLVSIKLLGIWMVGSHHYNLYMAKVADCIVKTRLNTTDCWWKVRSNQQCLHARGSPSMKMRCHNSKHSNVQMECS
jgi:hypothetical protein